MRLFDSIATPWIVHFRLKLYMLPFLFTGEGWQPACASDSVFSFMSSVGLVHFWFVSVAGLPSPPSTERLNSQSPGRNTGRRSAADAGVANKSAAARGKIEMRGIGRRMEELLQPRRRTLLPAPRLG